jgi:hypothetical protein
LCQDTIPSVAFYVNLYGASSVESSDLGNSLRNVISITTAMHEHVHSDYIRALSPWEGPTRTPSSPDFWKLKTGVDRWFDEIHLQKRRGAQAVDVGRLTAQPTQRRSDRITKRLVFEEQYMFRSVRATYVTNTTGTTHRFTATLVDDNNVPTGA